jgi:hypothetical protein
MSIVPSLYKTLVKSSLVEKFRYKTVSRYIGGPNCHSSLILNSSLNSYYFSYITDGTSDHVQAVCDTPNLVAKMIDLIASRDKVMIVPALRAVGNIITGDDHQTQFALEQNFMAVIPDLLASRHANVVKEACWALSNITAGTNAQVNYVIESGTVPTVVEVLFKSDFKTQKVK